MRAPETEEDLHDDGGYKAEHHTEPVRDQPPRHAEDRPQRQADTPEQMRMSLKATSARKADDSRKWQPAKDTITPRRPRVVPSSAPETAATSVHRASSCAVATMYVDRTAQECFLRGAGREATAAN